jgi:two-component system, chemotaxis family, chemotaxis protein CheY
MSCIVLIIDDAEQCAETLEVALFGLSGVDVVAAGSAERALQVIRERRVCAMITDLHLPHMSGFDLIRRARELPGYSHVPILVISGDSDPDTPERIRALGANAFFPKPYSPSAVRKKLETLLNVLSS